jgi:hypothetical protein
MKPLAVIGVIGGLLAVFAAEPAHAQSSSAIRVYERPAVILGTVTLPRRLMADAKPLAPGTYQVRLTNDEPKSAAGQSPGLERYVEFVRGGKVVGREVATVIFEGDIDAVAKGRRPGTNSSMVQMLKGGDYWRVWINKDRKHYLINLPPGT